MIVPHSWQGGASDSAAHVPCRLIAAALVSTITDATTAGASGLAAVRAQRMGEHVLTHGLDTDPTMLRA